MTLIKDCTEIYIAKNYNLCLVAKLDEGTKEHFGIYIYIYVMLLVCVVVCLLFVFF